MLVHNIKSGCLECCFFSKEDNGEPSGRKNDIEMRLWENPICIPYVFIYSRKFIV